MLNLCQTNNFGQTDANNNYMRSAHVMYITSHDNTIKVSLPSILNRLHYPIPVVSTTLGNGSC